MSGLLYLGAFHFDGDPGELLPGYHRLPAPRIEGRGDGQVAHLRDEVRP